MVAIWQQIYHGSKKWKYLEISPVKPPQICAFSESALNSAWNEHHLRLVGPSLTDICKVEVGKI